MAATNPFIEPLHHKQQELDAARTRLDALKRLRDLLDAPAIPGNPLGSQIAGIAVALGLSSDRTWLRANIGRLISDQQALIERITRELGTLQSQKDAFDDQAAELMADGATQEEAYGQLNRQADAKNLAKNILLYAGIAVLVAAVLYGGWKLYKRMRG